MHTYTGTFRRSTRIRIGLNISSVDRVDMGVGFDRLGLGLGINDTRKEGMYTHTHKPVLTHTPVHTHIHNSFPQSSY